jgi:Effector-associated domain 2
MLAEAIVGWLVEVSGDRLVKGISQSIFGGPDRRALTVAVDAATTAVIADLPPDVQPAVTAAVAEQFASPPAITLDARTTVRAALISAVHAQVAPLADKDLTPAGRSYFEEVGVDAARFRDDLSSAVIRAVEQVATSRPALAPLAAQLNADALMAEVRALQRNPVGQPTSGPGPAIDSGPAPHPAEPKATVFDVVDALLQVEAIADEGARREVLRELPNEISGAIPHHAVPRVQVLAMLRTCLRYPNGLRELLDAIRLVEPDSTATKRLEETAGRAFPELATWQGSDAHGAGG